MRQTSAQVVDLYGADARVGQQVVGVLNVAPERIGPFLSEFLPTGFHSDEGIVITTVERSVPSGARLA